MLPELMTVTSGMQRHCATVLLKHSGCDSDHFIHTSLLHAPYKKVLKFGQENHLYTVLVLTILAY